MPNWCSNSITITGPADKIQSIWTAVTGDQPVGLLQVLYPMPAELEDTDADGSSAPNWYNWRVENWGTKWDVDSAGLEFWPSDDGTATITGYVDTAWSPPVPAFQHYVDQNPDVSAEIRYFEPGMSFIGIWKSDGTDSCWDDVEQFARADTVNEPDLQDLFEEFGIWEFYSSELQID